MALPKVCGLETEYGIVHRGVPDPNPVLASSLLVNAYVEGHRVGWDFGDEAPGNDARGPGLSAIAPEIETHLANAVLTNGSRFYVDHAHPEYSTPECRTPLELLIADRAGEEILRRAMSIANARLPEGQEIVVYKNNSDGKSNSYGCHENYLLDRSVPFQNIVAVMLPWFVTRQIFCGSGKVGSEHGAAPVGFQISQRADFFEEAVGLETTLKRPLVNTRDEPHAESSRFRRLHVIAGDANCSETATFLKVACTSMVLAALEDGDPLAGYSLRDPVASVRTVSHDMSLRAVLELSDGRTMSALELQWEFFDLCQKRAAAYGFASVGPASETELALATWEHVLNVLERDPLELNGVLDWPSKLALIQKFAERDDLDATDPKLALIDLQYHDMRADRSLYQRLVQNGRMETLVSAEAVHHAVLNPPESTRAYFRGRCLQKWPDAVVSANWDSMVLDVGSNPLRRIPMMDPLKGTREHVESLFAECTTPAALVARLMI